MLANLPRVQAQERLHNQRFDPLDYQGIYDLYLDAYGDEDLASRARLQSMKLLVRQETEAARRQT